MALMVGWLGYTWQNAYLAVTHAHPIAKLERFIDRHYLMARLRRKERS